LGRRSFSYTDTSAVTLETGTGAVTVNVTDVLRPLTLVGNSNTTTVNVGTTSYDSDVASLPATAAYWSGTDDFATDVPPSGSQTAHFLNIAAVTLNSTRAAGLASTVTSCTNSSGG
jgi:hypothetical protein